MCKQIRKALFPTSKHSNKARHTLHIRMIENTSVLPATNIIAAPVAMLRQLPRTRRSPKKNGRAEKNTHKNHVKS